MADFSTILDTSNRTLDLYCHSITTSTTADDPRYAIFSCNPTQDICLTGGSKVVSFRDSQQKLANGIVPNPNFDTFTIAKSGTYLVSVSVQLTAVSVAGSQASLSVAVGGATQTFDTVYSNTISDYLYKATIYTPIVRLNDDPVIVQIVVNGLVSNFFFRYATLSIVKIA